jgi:hypothetical protein
MVDEALGAGEVFTVAIQANELDGLPIGPLQDARTSLVLRLGITSR